MVTTRKVQVGVWKRFQAFGFAVAPYLAGATHVFTYHGKTVEVCLPKRPSPGAWREFDSPITCGSYRKKSGRRIPTQFDIHEIDVYLDTKESRHVRDEGFQTIKTSLFTATQRKSVDELTNAHEDVLESAFDYWIDVLRWCTDLPTLCQLSYTRQSARTAAYLVDIHSRERFWATAIHFTVPMSRRIKTKTWKLTQKTLSAGLDVPIWRLTYAEAFQQLALGNVRGYIINLAISAETMARHLTTSFFAKPVNPKFQSLVNTVSISRLFREWNRIGFSSPAWRRLDVQRRRILELLDLRNGIMHRGVNPELSKNEQRRFGQAVSDFLTEGEKSQSGAPSSVP